MKTLILATIIGLFSHNAFAVLHCAEAAPYAVLQKVSADLKKLGKEGEVTTIIGSPSDSPPGSLVVLVGLGTDGAFAYKVNVHYEDITCIVDSIEPTEFTVKQILK